jgi:hypothetical protein
MAIDDDKDGIIDFGTIIPNSTTHSFDDTNEGKKLQAQIPKRTTNLATLSGSQEDESSDDDQSAGCPPLKKSKTLKQNGLQPSKSIGPAGLSEEYQRIVTKYKDLIQQVHDEDPLSRDDPTTQEEMFQILKRWDPQTDIICLYVRWARQLPKNFHLDSIATLLCLSNQCDYTPINFLLTVKTLHAIPSKNEYGFTIHFDSFGKMDSNGQKLNQRLKGLSITLALLQANVTRSNGLLGKTRMREKPGTRHPVMMQVATGDNITPSVATFAACPQIEFHTGAALAHRMWRSIHHRWMAFFVVGHLFRPKGSNVWNDQAALEFSFQMFSGFGRTRYDYLDPLTGVSLYFVTQDHDIEPNRPKLDKIWSDATLFVPFANSFINSITDAEKVRIMVEAFSELDMKTQKRYTYQPYQSFEKRWLLLRCFIFQQWLTRSRNSEMKMKIEVTLKTRKQGSSNASRSLQYAKSPDGVLAKPTALSAAKPVNNCIPVTTKINGSNGLKSLVSSQIDNIPLVSTEANDINKEMPVRLTHAALTSSSAFLHMKKKLSDLAVWSSARMLHPKIMDQLCASYLIIHREDGVDVLSKLTPLEVYSADWLCKRKHGRFSGDSNYYPSSHVGPVSLNISTNVKSFLDHSSSSSYQVARAGSSYLEQHGALLPNLEECIEICRAVIICGQQDESRSSGQFRINVGCGGQDRRNGIPCKIHDGGFKMATSNKSNFNSQSSICIPHLIGKCVEVIWKVMCDMLRDSHCSPMAPDPNRDWEYARHLREYLGIATQVGFEDVTVVVSSLYPSVNNVKIHVDQMNDNVSGYTRTGALNLCFGLGEPITNVLHLQV